MLLASAIEMARVPLTASSDSEGGARGGPQPLEKQERHAQLERRAKASMVLKLARQTTGTKKGITKKGGMVLATKKIKNRLRGVAKVEASLQAWATKRGRNVCALNRLLAFSVEVTQVDALLVRNRMILLPAEGVAQVKKMLQV